MKILNISFRSSPQYHDTDAWIDGYSFFYSIWEEVATRHDVIFLEFINAETEIKRAGIHYYFKRKSKLATLFPFGLNKFISNLKPDVVVVHGLMYPLQIILLRRALGRKVKIVVQHHAEKPLQGWRRWLQPAADKCIDAYWFTANDLATNWLEEKLISSPAKIFEVMETTSVFHVVDRKEARAVTNIAAAKSYLWVGRLNANKDPLLLVKTFLEFAEKHDSVRLYMVFQTKDLLPEMKSLMEKHPEAASAITLVGKVPHSELLYWYNSCDFIVSCSHYEGSGVAICEALSCGCIPLVTDIPSFNYMTGKACGKSFSPGDDAGLLSVLKASQNMDRAKERKRVLDQYQSRLSATAIAIRIQDILSSL
jgi:glycosyltransferase involved in cell wall biosynthesis